jgi:hypothetical protein
VDHQKAFAKAVANFRGFLGRVSGVSNRNVECAALISFRIWPMQRGDLAGCLMFRDSPFFGDDLNDTANRLIPNR